MRFGAPLFLPTTSPESWIAALRHAGYTAAFCPVDAQADEATVRAYAAAAEAANIVIAEVGAWSNPLSTDEDERRAALAHCQVQLTLADRIGARCCVNIAGSCGQQWDGPHRDNLTADTFERIVETVREIIDTVRPLRTFYALETMPWIFPDSPDNYLRLVRAIDRPRFGVHLDPVNMVTGLQRYYASGDFLRECFQTLGPWIKSCHAKDITLSGRLTLHFDEVRPGLGGLDYRTYLKELDKLDRDIPLMLEHLPNEEEYARAAAHLHAMAEEAGVTYPHP